MKPYYFLEEEATADVAFIANGTSMAEAFSNACTALAEVIVDTSQIQPVIEQTISFKAEDLQGLLYDLLDHLLFLFDTEYLVFSSNQVKLDIPNCSLVWTGQGDVYDPKKHTLHTHVKAMTFFGMEITDTYVKVTLDL